MKAVAPEEFDNPARIADAQLNDFERRQRHYFYLAENALINAKLAKAHMPYLFQKLVEDAMGFRRLAKFMRALERMAGEEGA